MDVYDWCYSFLVSTPTCSVIHQNCFYLVNTLVSMESYSKVPLALNPKPIQNNLKTYRV